MDRAEHVCSARVIHVNLFRYGKGIIDHNAKVPDGAFDLCVPEQELPGAPIAGTPIDQGRLGPP
jgi:hypothetical protein